jgi:4-hydroxybenzoate polyprenyltransferase
MPEITKQLVDSPSFWTHVFTLCAYAMAAGCLYRGIKEGSRDGVSAAFGQILIFAFFTFLYWFLESWAHHRTPYYVYSTTFSDLIPRCPWIENIIDQAKDDTCTKLVIKIQKDPDIDINRIPMSVILMEASLTYSAMWTTRILKAGLYGQPFLAGILLLTVDLLLDPVVAEKHNCVADAAADRVGIGLWHWFVDTDKLATWYGIPLFNFAAWLAAPICCIALANLFGPYFRGYLWRLILWGRLPRKHPPGHAVWLLAIIGGGILYLLQMAPNHGLTLLGQILVMAAAVFGVLVVCFFIFKRFRKYDTDETVDHHLARPVTLALLLPTIALAVEGFFVHEPLLIPLAVFTFTLGLWLVWLPYRKFLEYLARRIEDLDRLLRLHYFGFTAMMIVLGAAMVTKKPDMKEIHGLWIIAACFQVFAYLLNDVIDLEVDRGNPLRAKDPLVRGAITPQQGSALAWVAAGIALLTLMHLVSFNPYKNPWSFATLAVGLILMLIYNKFGKCFCFPPLTDLIQGLSWASLALLGALVADPDRLVTAFWERTIPLAAYGTFYILLISGVHGGLRDEDSDSDANRDTTVIALHKFAARYNLPKASPVIVYAFIIHTCMFGAAVYFLAKNGDLFSSPGMTGAVLFVFFLCSSSQLWHIVKPIAPERNYYISMHSLLALLPPIAMYVLSNKPDYVFKVVVVCSSFFPLLLQENMLFRFIQFAYKKRTTQPD